MDRQAFKQRMQNLKSYRENNPGKGYWDWKVQTFQDGGYTDDRTDHTVEKPIIHEPLQRYQPTIRQSEIDNSWKKYDIDNDGILSSQERMERQKHDRTIEDWKKLGKGISNTLGTAASLSSIIAGGGWALTRLISGNKATAFGRMLAPAVLPTNTLDNVGDVVDFAVDPSVSGAADIATGIALGRWKDFGSTARQASEVGSQILNTYNTFANGGQTGDPDKERFYQATGRSSSGRPLEEGLKPVFSLEDAANMTPIGDAISARDTYNAVKNRDWLSAGLAALTVLPFVPSGLRNVKAAARYIPTVNRTEQSLINQALDNISKKRDYLSDIANSRNRVLEDINTIPYRNRAEQADKIFGTNYSETYDLLDDLYQHRYFDLPEVQPKDMVASGRLQAKPFAEERFNKTGVGAEPNEFDLWVNTGMYRDPMQLANLIMR